MLLGSKSHTVGDTKVWTVDFSRWLANTATIQTITVTSSSTTCTISPAPVVLGQQIQFILTGGVLGETPTVSLKMVDSFGNTKNDTIAFCVLAP